MDNLDRMRQEEREERRNDGAKVAFWHSAINLITLAVIFIAFAVIWFVWLS